MPTQPFILPFPIGGISKRHSWAAQAQGTTPDALNVIPTDWTTGREMGGTRPGMDSLAAVLLSPYNWCEVAFINSSSGSLRTYRGIAVTCSTGTYISTIPAYQGANPLPTFTRIIGVSPQSSFSSCGFYHSRLFQASANQEHIFTQFLGEEAWKNDATGLSEPVRSLNQTDELRQAIKSGSIRDIIDEVNNANLTNGVYDDGYTPYLRESVPEYCGLIATFMDRLVVAGDRKRGNVIYFSAVNDWLDWDYSSPAAGGAFASPGGVNGTVGEIVTALIPHTRNCLLIGGPDRMAILRGNPKAGGQFDTLCHTHGPLMQSAWCKTGNDYTYFLSREGLWRMPPGCGEAPQSVSRELLPDELLGINPGNGDTVTLGYDSRFRGIHIYAYRNSERIQWFHDLQTGGFWRLDVGQRIQLAANHKAAMTEDRSGLILFNASGNAYQWDRTDTSESFSAHVYYGPIDVGGSPHTEGILNSINCVLGYGSNGVQISLQGGDSPQEAFNAPTQEWDGEDWDEEGKMNYEQHPRMRATAAYLKVHQTTSQNRWAIEEVWGEVSPSAKRRSDSGP